MIQLCIGKPKNRKMLKKEMAMKTTTTRMKTSRFLTRDCSHPEWGSSWLTRMRELSWKKKSKKVILDWSRPSSDTSCRRSFLTIRINSTYQTSKSIFQKKRKILWAWIIRNPSQKWDLTDQTLLCQISKLNSLQ